MGKLASNQLHFEAVLLLPCYACLYIPDIRASFESLDERGACNLSKSTTAMVLDAGNSFCACPRAALGEGFGQGLWELLEVDARSQPTKDPAQGQELIMRLGPGMNWVNTLMGRQGARRD